MNGSQPSVCTPTDSTGTMASPGKRGREKPQFIGPAYCRMQNLSFCIPIDNLALDFINPLDPQSIARGCRVFMDTVYDAASKKGLNIQCRKGSAWKRMGGAVMPHAQFSPLVYTFMHMYLHRGWGI
jgi:hypothetical protein